MYIYAENLYEFQIDELQPQVLDIGKSIFAKLNIDNFNSLQDVSLQSSFYEGMGHLVEVGEL